MITVLGGAGFIGRHLVAELRRRGIEYRSPGRSESLDGRSLGDVVYCAGVTADHLARPLDTVAAHVGLLEASLRSAEVDSLVYLSTTRLYRPHGRAREDQELWLNPSDPDQLYDLSKATGEALALGSPVPALVLRLSHVYGFDRGSRTFLASVVQEALRGRPVTLRTSLDSTRNYVGVKDVVAALLALLANHARGIYNVAGARPTSHREITEALTDLTKCEVRVADGAPTETAPEISIARISSQIDYDPEPVLGALPRLVEEYRRALALPAPTDG